MKTCNVSVGEKQVMLKRKNLLDTSIGDCQYNNGIYWKRKRPPVYKQRDIEQAVQTLEGCKVQQCDIRCPQGMDKEKKKTLEEDFKCRHIKTVP